MKQRLLFIVALLCSTVAGWAQTWEASTVGEGDFYLYNVGTGQFLQGGNSWGTQASLSMGGAIGHPGCC